MSARAGTGRRQGFVMGMTIGVVGVSLLAGGVAVAAIPATGTGLITGCRSKSTGALRVIDAQAKQKCKSTEKSLAWNAKGVPGAKGATGATGAAGAPGAPGPSGPKGSNSSSSDTTLTANDYYDFATPEFTATADATCMVTSTVQLYASTALPAGTTNLFVRNAVSRNGTATNDVVYGFYLVSNGLVGRQAAMTRSSVMGIKAGEKIQFGAYVGGASGSAVGDDVAVQTAYFCS